jgi:hypothetical protein
MTLRLNDPKTKRIQETRKKKNKGEREKIKGQSL